MATNHRGRRLGTSWRGCDDDVRLSCLSAGGGGLLGMVDFTAVRVKAASLRSALFCYAKKPSGLDPALREVVMRGRRPLSACGKATSCVFRPRRPPIPAEGVPAFRPMVYHRSN